MPDLDDETLMAYIDGELDEQTSLEIEHALEADPDAFAKVELFRKTAHQLSDTYRPIVQAQAPRRLQDAVGQHQIRPVPARST